MPEQQEFDYVAYVGFATANPGPGARCVLVTQGEKRHAATEKFSTTDESIDDVIVNSIGYALRVLEKRADKRVQILCNSARIAAQLNGEPDRCDGDALRAVRAVLKQRPGFELFYYDGKNLDEASDLAWKAAFGRPQAP